MYSRRSIISVTILTHPNPGFTGNRNIHFSPGTFIGNRNAYIRVVPNIAITEHSSLTLITSRKAGKEHQQLIKQTFEEGGKCLFAEEKQLDIISALTSSGIAFALKYIHAAMQAGIELGISAEDAMRMTAYSMEGATELILNHDTHPLLEIEKAATPGGATIKGLNELEHRGFTSAVIHAIKSSATVSTDKETEE